MPKQFILTPSLLTLKKALSSRSLSGKDESVEAVVAVLLLEDANSDLTTLLIHRVERTDDPWSGQIGLPGGRVEKSDHTPRAALKREVLEEVGLNLDSEGEELGPLSIGSPMRRLGMRVQPWVYALNHRPEVRIGPEVQETLWVSLSKLPSLRSSAEIEIRGEKRTVESFLVDGHIVWGYTHRVLNELLAVLQTPLS